MQIYKSLKQTMKQAKWTTKASQGEYLFFIMQYRDLRAAKKHRDLLALEKPADWTLSFSTSEKRHIDALFAYIIIFTGE